MSTVTSIKTTKSTKTTKAGAVKPTAKSVAKEVAAKAKAKVVAVASKVPSKPATKAGTEVTLADTARAFIAKTFADKSIESPRAVCIKHFMEVLGMQKTTASTYFSNAIRAALTAEHAEAQARLEQGKPVYSAYKLNNDNIVTSVGMFVSSASAHEFNDLYRHNGVVKGEVVIGSEQKDHLASKKKASAKTAKVA